MTPQEKAKELYNIYNNLIVEQVIEMKPTYLLMTHEMAKKSALITINEMINISYNHYMASYYAEVKQEIKNL